MPRSENLLICADLGLDVTARSADTIFGVTSFGRNTAGGLCVTA